MLTCLPVGCSSGNRIWKLPQSPTSRPADAGPFWWGVSVSSYQTEDPAGASFKTDWDLYHKAGRLRHARGDGTVSYSQVERDIAALKQLGVSHYRFSIEWARVEPSPGAYDEAAIEHYVKLAARLREVEITPVVCLWHFTFPAWLADIGHPARHGWLHPLAKEHWRRYVELMARRLAPYVSIFAPQNEPNSYALGVVFGGFPPGGPTGHAEFKKIIDAEAQAFVAAARIIRSVRSGACIISIQSIIHWQRDLFDLFGFWYNQAVGCNHDHLDRIKDEIDLVGINYYQREVASPLASAAQSLRSGENVSDMGWWIDPDGLEMEIAVLAQRYRKPLVIMENGIADRTDRKRELYLVRHLLAVKHAREAGYDVRGYFHWSLIDNYEWTHGYAPRFGLFELSADRRSLRAKASADLYRAFIQGGFFREPP